ncbi:hypothetical protein CF98_35520 [Halopseudomonas bauzanensis]|nr:hypothetical protein CF98_35520 [Halopseudomonas bauzanensis]
MTSFRVEVSQSGSSTLFRARWISWAMQRFESQKARFFDRGVLDALYMLDAESALTCHEISHYVQQFPYNGVVFLLPPWKEIYATDSERDQDFEESVRVFEGMRKWYSEWGYETVEVPRGKVDERVSFILQRVNNP